MRKYDDLVILAGKENTTENILFVTSIDEESKTYILETLFGERIEGTFTDSDLVDFVPNYDKKTKEKLTFNYKEIADSMTGFKVIVEALQEEQEKMFNDMIKYSIYQKIDRTPLLNEVGGG